MLQTLPSFVYVIPMLIAILLFAAAIILLFKSVYLVSQAEVVIIERFGQYSRTLKPGIHFVLPLVENPHIVNWTRFDRKGYRYRSKSYRIDMREMVNDFPKQHVITKDNVNMEINALLFYQLTDPKSAVYEVFDVPEAIEKLTQTTLRSVIGSMDLDETLSSRDVVNIKLQTILDEATDKWGVKVNRVELQEVNPPRDIIQAMEKQMRAERDKRATIIESEGRKRATILDAEGGQEARLLDAKAKAEARYMLAESEARSRVIVAKAEAEAIQLFKKEVPEGDPLSYLVAQQYIKTLPKMMEGKDNKMIVVPYEAAGITGSLSVIKQLFNNDKK